MKYIVIPVARFIACVLMAQVFILTSIIVLAWSLNRKTALEQAAFIWRQRYDAQGAMVMAVYVAAIMALVFNFRSYFNL